MLLKFKLQSTSYFKDRPHDHPRPRPLERPSLPGNCGDGVEWGGISQGRPGKPGTLRYAWSEVAAGISAKSSAPPKLRSPSTPSQPPPPVGRRQAGTPDWEPAALL